MKSSHLITVTLAVAVGVITLGSPAAADERRGHDEGHFHGAERGRDFGHWHGGMEHFRDRDFHVWREGRWEHRWHDGHYGWWWFAGGLWYSYPVPIYPYPDPYVPPVVAAPPVVATPGPVAAAPPPPQYWYYCDSARGYYPYVPSCQSGWRAVPPAPAH